MRLSDYLDRFAWSQAELARQAGVSPQCVARALRGEKITRRNAEAIIAALQRKYKAAGLRGAITLASVKGLHISDLRRKKKRAGDQEEDTTGDLERYREAKESAQE
jgi:DNA-binding XRE family transcriptional regulator